MGRALAACRGSRLRRLAVRAPALLLAGGLVVALPATSASATPTPPPPPGAAALPPVKAAAYVVADLDTGRVLAAKAAHLRLPPASTLKTLTALTVAPHLAPDMIYRATRADADVEGSRVGIVAGDTYTVRDLLFGLFLRSGNDAASALANAAGGWPSTVAEMNATARRLGALDTFAVNPSGLDEPGQLSSAHDLALIGRAVLRDPELRSYPQRIRHFFPGKIAPPGQPRPYFEIHTQQKFVEHYPGALGLKNGFTTLAHNTLVTAARRDGRTVLVALLGCPGQAWQAAAALSDWAFANAGQVQPVGALDSPAPAQPEAAAGKAPDAPAQAADPEPLLAATARIPARYRQLAGLTTPLGVALAGLAALATAAVVHRRPRAVRDRNAA